MSWASNPTAALNQVEVLSVLNTTTSVTVRKPSLRNSTSAIDDLLPTIVRLVHRRDSTLQHTTLGQPSLTITSFLPHHHPLLARLSCKPLYDTPERLYGTLYDFLYPI